LQKGIAARSLLFEAGGPMAKQLARHGVALKVNDWLFAHGGIMPHHGEITYLGPSDIHFPSIILRDPGC
jgi:hypothetical protein